MYRSGGRATDLGKCPFSDRASNFGHTELQENCGSGGSCSGFRLRLCLVDRALLCVSPIVELVVATSFRWGFVVFDAVPAALRAVLAFEPYGARGRNSASTCDYLLLFATACDCLLVHASICWMLEGYQRVFTRRAWMHRSATDTLSPRGWLARPPRGRGPRARWPRRARRLRPAARRARRRIPRRARPSA